MEGNNARFMFRVWKPKLNRYTYIEKNDYCGVCGLIDYEEYNDDKENVWEQCTGLKDRNGKFVFEGDDINIDGKLLTVKWNSEGYYNIAGYGYILRIDYICDYEIIGNIHEVENERA